MGILFISHSSRDNEVALKLRNWLKEHGWGQSFLDLDPQHGLAPGHRWQQELKQAGERCSAVILLVSPNWVSSLWCRKEFELGHHLGKKVFPVVIAPTPSADLPAELKEYQFADISTVEKEAEGLARLAIGLKRAGLDPKSFDWPPADDPQRPIYRGLQSLDERDAAIFFGRDTYITKALDSLRRMRDGAPERLLVILGASGAGKSSFLKAGLMARLKRDEENFLVLPLVRPGRAALTGDHGLAASLARDGASLNGPDDLVNAFAARRADVVERLKMLADSAGDSYAQKPPTLVIAIDQAEELFQAENKEAAQTLELLAAATRADRNLIVVAAIRSDAFEKLQSSPLLEEISRLPFDLPPLPHGSFQDVIEGPARLTNPPLAIEPALTERLQADLAEGDALPLLAFTLERLWIRHRGGGTLTLAEYVDELGGLQGAISNAVEAAFADAQNDPALPRARDELEKLARAAFIPALVQLNDADAEPRRRIERVSALPAATRSLVRHLINQRLLVSDRNMIDGVDTETVEVAHEAILRQWPALKSWIAQERDGLRALDGVRAAAMEWRTHANRDHAKQGQGWLTHRGGRLEEAEALARRPDFAHSLNPSELEYIAACRANEDAQRLRERKTIARTRRFQRIAGAFIAATAVVVLLAGASLIELLDGIDERASDTLTALAAKEAESGNYDRAARYALVALTRADSVVLGYHDNHAEAELQGIGIESSALAVLRGHTDVIWSAAFSPDGTRIVTASWDNTARIWNALTGAPIAALRGHEGKVWRASFSPDGRHIVTASDDETARIWDARTFRQISVLRGHTGGVTAAAFSPDGRRIVTASGDKTARIWDANTGRAIATMSGHENDIRSAVFSRDGTRIVTASRDKTARIWDASTGHEMAVLRGHSDALNSAAFSPDGTRIVTASEDKTVRIWDTITAHEISVLNGFESTVQTAAFSPDGMRIVTASWDNTVRIWDAATGSEVAVRRGHDDRVDSAAFSTDGKRIVTSSHDGTARVWNADTSGGIAILGGNHGSIWSAAFSPDGKRVVTAADDKTGPVWDAASAREIAVLRGHDNSLEYAAYSSDGTRIVTAADDNTARIWDAATARQITVLQGHRDAVETAMFSFDGRRVVTASRDNTARIWDVNSSRQISVLNGHDNPMQSAAFSPDGMHIVTGSADGTARIWNADSAREMMILRGHEGAVGWALFSPDGARVLTSSEDKTARLWNAKTGGAIAILRGHEGALNDATFSSNGNRIVTASGDKSAGIWDVDTGREIAILRGHGDKVETAAFSPDGTRIVTASKDKTAMIWNVSAVAAMSRADLIRRTCERTLPNGLSKFSEKEYVAAPVLDPRLDVDACRPLTLWARLSGIFSAALSR